MGRILLLAGLFVMCAGCPAPSPAGDGGPTAGDGGAGTLELGTGFAAFEPLDDGAVATLHAGCQGSQHVWISLRTTGLDPAGPLVELRAVRTSDSRPVSTPLRVRVSFDPIGAAYELKGLTLQLPVAADVIGQQVRISATVTDRGGLTASDETTVTVQWGESACAFDGDAGLRN